MKKTLFKVLLLFILTTLTLNCGRDVSIFTKYRFDLLPQLKAKKFILDNGLKVLIRENHNFPLVSIVMLVDTRSALGEGYAGSGISHFVEHMLFKGTDKRDAGQIFKQIRKLGGNINGYTTYEYTYYTINFPKEGFKQAIEILEDVLTNSSFEPEEVEKEREVILKEIALNKDDPQRKLNRLFFETSFRLHPYRYPVIGYKDLFLKLKRCDLINYYKKYYIPSNIIISIVGDIDTDKTVKIIKQTFGKIKKSTPRLLNVPQEPKQRGIRKREIFHPVNLTYVNLGYHSVSINSKDLFALDVLAQILGEGKSSTLYKKLKQELGLVLTINAYNYTPFYPGIFGISFTTNTQKNKIIIEKILKQIEDIKKGKIKSNSLTKAKNQVIADYIKELETTEGQARILALDEFLTGNFNFYKDYIKGICSVKKKEVVSVAQKFLNIDNLTICMLLPEKIQKNLKNERNKEKGTFKFRKIKKIILPNKLKLLLMKDSSIPLVSVYTFFKAGLRAETEKTNGISNLCARLFLSGTTTRTAAEITETIENRGGNIGVISGNNSIGISIQILSKYVDKALEILADILKYSQFPEEEVIKRKKDALAAIKLEKDSIFQTAMRILRRELFISHPYRFMPIGSEESIKDISRTDIINFYKKYIIPQNMVLCIYGDIDIDETISKIKSSLGNWRRKSDVKIITPPQEKIQSTKYMTHFMEKEQSLFLIGFPGISVYDKDRYSLEILQAILSGAGSRINQNIREKKAQAYLTQMFIMEGIDPGFCGIVVATDYKNLDEVEQIIFKIIDDIKNKGVEDSELNMAINDLTGNRLMWLQSNANLAYLTSLDELYGLGYDNYTFYEERIRNITKKDIQDVAKRIFNLKNAVVIKIMPEIKAEGKE